MAKTFSLKSDDPLKFLSKEALGSRASMDDADDDSSSGSSRDDDDDEDDDDSSSGSSRDDNDDFVLIDGVFVKLRGNGSIDDSQPGGLRDDFVQIDGVFVKLRGDGSVDDSQPNGLIRANGGGLKLRGNGSIDDSQPGELRIVGTGKDDKIIGTGVSREYLIGGKGSDDFILGNRNDSYYQDGRKDRTYAIMKDFSGKDEVILHGSLSDYKFISTKVSGVNGLGIFYKDDDGTDLIGLIAGKGNLGIGSLDFL